MEAGQLVPNHLRAPAGKALLREHHAEPPKYFFGRSASSPELPRGHLTTSGLPAASLEASMLFRTQPVAAAESHRRDAIPGYLGYIPGKKAETVFGDRFMQTNAACHSVRPPPERPAQPDHEWRHPSDHPLGRRKQAEVNVWRDLQQFGPWINNGQQPRNHGSATIGYGGHRNYRASRATDKLTEALEPGSRVDMSHTLMRKERDNNPWDVHRPALPGYSGHIRLRNVQ